jgi:hypothetical protein
MAEAQPYFHPLTGGHSPELGIPQHDRLAAAEIASREQMERDRAMGRPYVAPPELPVIKEPVLPGDFAAKVAALDQEILDRGIAVDRERLMSLGKQRFTELLAADRKAPRASHGGGMDLTRWESVQPALHAFQAPGVPVRKMIEQATGAGKERDSVRQLSGFDDLWKAGERREVIDDIFAFRDLFESLAFGHSMLARLGKDGRLRSRFLCGGRGRKIDLFRDWFSVLEGPLTNVALVQPLFSLMAWLANERVAPPSLLELGRDFFNVRAPSEAQVKTTAAVLDAFLLDYDGWRGWERIGRKTRASIHVERLTAWRTELARRFLSITDFHAEVRAAHYSDAGFGSEAHRQFEPARHRAAIDRMIRDRFDVLSAALALAMEACFPGAVLARFENSILCKGAPKQRAEISAKLAAVFPGGTFQLGFERLP